MQSVIIASHTPCKPSLRNTGIDKKKIFASVIKRAIHKSQYVHVDAWRTIYRPDEVGLEGKLKLSLLQGKGLKYTKFNIRFH